MFFHCFAKKEGLRIRRVTFATGFLGLLIFTHSVLFSQLADVSILKAISWSVVMTTLLSAWINLTVLKRQELSKEIFLLLTAVLFFSLPLLNTSVGYLRNGSGFQGILNHPQVFGSTMALLGTWAASLVFTERRPRLWLFCLVGMSVVAVFVSQARTAGVAMVFGTGSAFLMAPAMAGRPISTLMPGFGSGRVGLVLLIAAAGGVALFPVISDAVGSFISKSGRGGAGGLLHAYEMSRGGLIDAMMANVAKHPLTGIGFGIASEPTSMAVSRDPIFGLPVGASIEKGVAPLAVLEELGTLGAIAVAFWFFSIFRTIARGGISPLAVCMTVLFLNMGESTIFSPGGFGLLTLVLLAWGFASGRVSNRNG